MKTFRKLHKYFFILACAALLFSMTACQKETPVESTTEEIVEASTEDDTEEIIDYSTGTFKGIVVASDANTVTIETEDGAQTCFTTIDAEVEEGTKEIGALISVSISIDPETYPDEILPADEVFLIEAAN